MFRNLVIFLAGSVATYAAALLARHVLLPDIVPIAWAEESQPLWTVEAAFLLRAIEFVAMGTALLAVLAIGGLVVQRGPRTLTDCNDESAGCGWPTLR